MKARRNGLKEVQSINIKVTGIRTITRVHVCTFQVLHFDFSHEETNNRTIQRKHYGVS